MTLTDYKSRNKEPPEWVEEDQTVLAQGRVGEDIIVELKFVSPENYDDLQFELIRDGLPISSDRYRLSMRGNIVQLALKQSRKNDTGYYSLVATRLGQENSKGAAKKIHLSVSEQSYEDGEPPVFLRRLSDLAVKVGTRTRFLVEIRSSSTLKITWYKDDSPINDGLRFSLVHEGNFHCVDVAPVTVEDQGSWTCMAENRSGRSSCTSTLTVIVPKAYKKPEFVEELRALLTETGTVSLECKVVGVPTPMLKWFKDNKEIKAGDVFALTANLDDPTSLGVYTCEAVNCMGTAYSSSKVHVVGRGSREGSLKPADALTPSGPLPVFKQFLQDECCRIGDDLLLSCRVQVPPWPKTITWYNKEGRVEPSEKYHIIEDGIGGYSIEVKQVEAVDEGEWKCVATSEENMKQFSSCYVAMSIPRNYRKPRFMENLKAVLTEEGLVSFECKVVGFPTPLLRWFKDGQELKPGDVYQLTGTNSLGSYCCIARNCMGEAKSTAELTIEDIQNQLNEEERFQLLSINQPPKFIKGLRSCEAKINEDFRFTVQVSVAPEPTLSWYRDDTIVDESDKYHQAKENLGKCHLEVQKLEFVDQAEWKCVAANDFGHSVTSCFLKLIIPKHYKKPIFLESLRAILSEEGAVNLECKVIGVPQPVLKWYKDNVELKPGDIHRIISGQDGTCCLGVYTCEATNCMGTVSSSASLLGFEEAKAAKQAKEIQSPNDHELARNLSLSTIHEERTSQLYDTPQTDHSVTLDERGEISFSFDGKEVSVSLYETPDLTEEEALQIVEMYADQLSEHVTEHNVIELPPMRFVKETSTSGNLLMEAVVIDVSPDYFVSAEDDLRTEADVEDVSIMDDVTHVLSSPERDSRSSLKRSARYNGEEDEKTPSKPPRKKSMSISSSKSEKSQRIESESFHSAQKDEEPPLSPLPSSKQDDSDTFADALSSAHLSITESLIQKKDILEENTTVDNRKRSLSEGRSTGSSLDDGIGGDSSFDLVTGVPKTKKQRRKKQHKDKSSSEEYSGHSDYDRKRRRSKSEDDAIIPDESVNGTEPDVRYESEQKKLFIEEEFLDNLKDVKEAINISDTKEIEETTKDILLESRVALRKALKACEKIPETLVRQFSSIHERISDVYQIVEVTQEKDIENLNKLEKPLHTLLKSLSKITSAEEIEIIRNILEPSIVQLLDVVENLGLPSLQSTLTDLNKVNERICNIPSETEKETLIKSTSDTSGNISEEIVDPLIDIQSAFSAIIDYMERSKLNKTPQEALKTSPLATCLTELRECVSHTAHTAMTFRENETLNSLMEFKEPLLDLQSILAMEDYTPQELPIIKETTLAIKKLKCVVVNILKNSGNREALSRAETILTILKDTDKQVLQLVEQLLEIETAQKQALKSLNIDQSLSNVHFALSSVLEKQEEHKVSSNLITCIETLRQAIGSSAVTIASLKNPVDEEITQEISRLKESLLNLQKDLLTEKHKSGEEEILNNLMSPISRLKDIIHGVIKQSSSTESMVSILQLLEEIERDATLIAKEISKKKVEKESDTKSRMGDMEEKSSSNLAGQINRSLHPLKYWLSTTSEDSTKDEVSELSSTIEELKRDVTQIAIQTSYSEPPSDESLIEALIELREPLIRLKNAISTYHGPENLSTLENLDRPMKHLLQTITDVLQEHANEESLLSIVHIVQQIENQLPLSIKNALYQQELKQSTKTSNVETEEEDEAVTASRETIPGTLTEIASTPLFESTVLPIEQATEQVTTEDNSKKAAEITPMIIKSEMQEREKKANKLITILSETLEKLQLEMTGILEDFEESTTRTTMIPQSKLANSLEELRRTISTIRMMTTVYSEEIGSSEEKVHQATLILTNLTQPLINIQELLSKSHKHDVLEFMILNRLIPLLNTIENNVIKPTTQFINKDGDTEKEFEFLLYVLEEIKTEVPIVIQKISSKQKILECLWDISKPLENIMERMKDLEQTKETLETDVAKILGNPTATLLKDIKTAIQETDVLDRRESVIVELRKLLEPLQEFHSCLSMIQSSRKSLVPEVCLLEERRSVILRAIDGLQKQVCHTVEAIANMKEAFLFNESLMQLNSAILKVQKQIGKTDYSRRSSSVKIPLQHRLTGTLDRLASAILALEDHADKDTREVVSKCLEALQKQISFTQMQFIEIGSELVDEEAIVEGFLYPTSQVLSSLNVLKENMQKASSAISHSVIVQLQELADSILELSSSLSMHKAELVQEGASNEAPIVETFSAVIDVLDEVKDSIVAIEKVTEQKASVIITESVTDEIIEISQEEIETIMVITETSTEAVVQESVESKIEDAPQMTQTSVFKTSEVATRPEQEVNLVDAAKHEETQEEKEKQKYLITQTSKFNSAINNLTQPLQGLSNFIKSATQESLISKSDEDKRKIQELTALMQIIYDLQATNTSIKTCIRSLSSSLSFSSSLLNNDFSRMENIFDDLEQAVAVIIFLTDEGVKPELKENIMTSLQSFAKPLNDLENVLESICQTINENKYFDENGEFLVTTARVLIPYISDTIKCLKMIQIPKYVQIVDEKETEISKIKEEVKNIEETTARPLEELIEAIMESQEQVKCDKILESSSPFADLNKPKDNDDLKLEMETEVSEVKTVSKMDDIVKEVSNLSTQDAVATPQQVLTPSPTLDQIEEHVEKKREINLIKEYFEEVKEKSLEITDKENIEIIKSPEKDIMQKEQITIETLQLIFSPLQVLHKSLDEVEKVGVLEFSDRKTVAFSTLLEPLINLELPLLEDSTEMNQSAVTLQKLSVACVLEELQKSVATVQQQVQLYTAVEASPSEITKMRLMQAVEKPLEDLKMSLASIQSDPTICQQGVELLGIEQITVLQTLAKSVEEFGEKCMSIIDQVKLEEVPPLQIAPKQEEQTLNPEILQKIVDPIHILHETLSQINDFHSHKAELLEIQQEKGELVQLSAVIDPLKKLERLLITDVQHVAVAQEKVTKDLEEHQVLLANADLKPVLEELKTSISVVQQQVVSSENNSATETLNKALESLKMPLTVIEETLDHSHKVTETEKVSTLLSFAKSVTETANQLVTIAKQDMAQQENQVTSLLKTITIPIEGLQSEILELEDRVSQTMETKESKKVVALECMVQPLQELQQSFLAASHQEIALSLQRLPIKPVLDNLNKFVAEIQEQVAIVQDNLAAKTPSDDVIVLKDFARSLSNLRTSTVVLQQLNAIENASQQIVEIENASALQAFAKSVEEFRKCCSVVVERPKVVEAFTSVTELKQPTKVDTQLLENIIVPLRILQEQILTIEETKMQESEILEVEIKKPVNVLSSLVGLLQQLEKSFVATVCKEQVIEYDGHSLASDLFSVNLEKLALQPILEEVQKSIATVQEQVVFETGSHITSETETDILLKSIAQPLVDLKASIASIQQVTTVAPDSLNELAQQNVSALETFAETLHNLSECIAMCNHQQVIIEPADTISEGASSLNTWADIVEEPLSRVTCPMVIDQGAIESPAEIAMSISEDEASALKTLAKPLTELRECLAIIIDERKMVAPSDTTRSLSEKEDISLLKTMIQPLLELNDAATAVIQEQIAIERAKEHLFEIEGNNEYVLRPLIEPLEELRHSIATIQDQMLVETSTDRQRDNVILGALAEPLFDLQRAISVLEARVMSPDVQSIPEDTSSSWITECLAIPLHEIERSIADIRQCTIMEPKTIMVEAQARTITPDWSIVEKLEKPVERIKSVVSRIEDDFTKAKVLKPMVEALIKVQQELTSLKNTYAMNTVNEEQCFNAIIEPLSNLEKCILSVKKEIDKPKSKSKLKEITILSSALTIPLTELECCIVTAKESPNANLKNLERPLELVQNALETILSAQRSKKFSDLSTKVVDTISDIQKSIESIEYKLEQQQVSVLEVCIECEALRMLAKPLQNIKQSISQIQENPSTANLMIDALRNLKKSVAIIREQSADKPLAEPQHLHFDIAGNLLKCLVPCLNELQESIQASKLLWCEETALEGLTILDEPIYKLKTAINIICDQILKEEIFWIDTSKAVLQKKVKKKDREESDEIESVKKEDKTPKVENEDTKSVDKDLSTTTNDEENKKNLYEKEKKEKESEKVIKKQVEKVVQEQSEQKNTEKDKMELKKQEKVEKIENAEKQKDIKNKKDKETSELYKEKDKTEESKKEDNQKKEKELDKTEQKEQKHIKLEIDKTEIKKQEKEEEKEKLKEEKGENLKSEKIEELEKKQDKSSKKELTQEKIREEKQIKIQEKEKEQKKQKIELEKKQEEPIKKKGFIQEKIKEEEQKQIEIQEKEKEQKKQEVKEVKEEKSNSQKITELEKKQEEPIKIEDSIQEKIIQEEQKQKKQKNKVKIGEKEQKKNKATEKIKEQHMREKEVEIIKEKETEQKEKKEMKKVEEKDETKSEKIAKVETKEVKKDEIQQEEKKIKDKVEETSKKVKDEKTKENIEDLELENKSKIKEEPTQEKITEKKQTDQKQIREKRKEQKKEEILEKEEKEKELKEEKTKELEKKIQEFNKTETSAEKIKEKEKDEVKISKKEAKEQLTQETEEIKAKDKETKSNKDVQEKKKTLKKSKQENATVETVKEKSIKEKKEEIVKTKETVQLTQSERPKDTINFHRQQEEKRSHFEEIERSKRKVEDRQWRSQDNENWLCAKENERADKSDKYKMQKEKPIRTEYDNQKTIYKMEIEHLEKRRTVGRSKKEDVDYIFDKDKERNYLKRNEETRIRRDETARFLREEEQKLRRKHEEEIYRSKQRREEQIRESEWSRRRENETDRFLKNMLENRYKSDKSTALFFDDYHRDYISRLESSMPTLTSSFRSYSWRDSLNRNLDEYKLRDSPINKYYYDTGSSYRRRRKRENRIIRARSISLMKYEDYSTEDSDATIIPSTHTRSRRKEAARQINFNAYEPTSPRYIDFGKREGLPWDKSKKPSFCTKLTNRTVGVGMRIRLTCTVLGNPEPRVYWTKDDYRLDASDSRCKTRYENGMAYLELYDANPEDAGLYTCVAENAQGTSSTESLLRVYSDYKPTHSPPIFVKSIKDTYRHSDCKLILECRVRAHPTPSVSWLKDGQILKGERYKQSYLDDDVYRLEISNPNVTDNGQYICRAENELHTEKISHMVHVEDWQSLSRSHLNLSDAIESDVIRRPRFSNFLKDYSVPAGGTIALQVEVKGVPPPEVKWLRGDRKEPIAIPKAKIFTERGLHTLIVPEATESERGTYVCRAINAYGQVDTSATVHVISGSAIDGGKPAMFVSKPSKKSIDVIVGEDVSISFRVSGVPKPRVIWMKGLTDITDGPRSYKETIDDYVRLTLKKALPSDEGTYCILVKNRYGCDRSFFSIKVKQRARSLTPSPDWNSVKERDAGEEQDDDMSYIRNVPGPISSEPVAVDGGKNWLSLTWGKAERRGPAPVIAYKVDAWQLGIDGGARWIELGITPINAFDAFNLRPGGEYKFRVTPRNRYGWGEPVTMTNSVTVSESTDLPEFTKILPGQLKALEGTSVKLECEIRGDSKAEMRWYCETTEIDARNDSRFTIYHTGSQCSLTITNVKENDSGRYVCEASNKIGKMSSFARVLVVTDPRIIEADAKLRTTNLSIKLEDRPPQFTMRIRDRRVQTTYPVRLTCQVTGQPVPEITWYKNETEISQDDRHIFWDDDSNFHTLEIIHSTLDDSGCYMVTARNINGSVSCRCNLVVDKGIRAYIAPEFLRDLDAVYTINSGEELRLSAQLEAYPSVGVVWHRDGIRLRPSRRAMMTLSHDGTVQFSLANVTARDAGIYSCTATNVVGNAETSTRVTVTEIHDQSSIDGSSHITSASPDVLYSKEPLFVTKPLSTEAVEGDTVIILCEVVGDPKPEVIWLRDFLKPDYYRDAPHFRLVGAGPQYRLEIPYAKLDFTGTYSVIARNCHGEAKAVISLQIYAKGQGKEEQTQKSPHGKVLTLPIIKRDLQDIRCCDGDAVSLECKVHAAPEPPLVRWERGGKIIAMVGDFASEFDGETARLSIQHVYPEDEGEYTCVAYNDLGKAYTSACLVVDVPEGKENILSQRLTRPVGLLSAGSTPRSTPRSTPIRSLSPAVPHGREFRSPQILPRSGILKRPKICPPKFYAVPHNRLVQEGETVRFQCAVVGHPAPWVRWDKNGMIVTPSTRISIKERDDVKILEIVDVMREDAALYRVTAENDFGRIEASARLEVINRYESTSRTIRTRSASPRTYPSFDRSLLPTTSRINGRLQLECRVKESPSVTPTWYRNGRPLERSDRIKRYFDGTTAKIEISKVKASDAGEYTCVATNVLGSTRSSCQVTVLDPYDSSTADKSAPRFVQSLPEETIVMENHCHEFQTGITGTSPLIVSWFKDGRELPDNDYYKHIIYGDGGVALRLSEVCPQDAGEYTCVVRNDFGATSCTSLFAVQDYREVSQIAPQFTKTPLSVTVAKGNTACFCARVQCGKPTEIIWTINGKDARDNAKCKIEKDDNVSILRIRDVSSRDTGDIRCTASVNGKGPSISCVAKLRLQRSLHDPGESAAEDVQFRAPANASLISVSEKILERSSLKCRRQCEQSPTRAKSSSFLRRTASCAKEYVSFLPARKRVSKNALNDVQKLRIKNGLSAPKNTKTNLDRKVEVSEDRQLSLLNEKDTTEVFARSPSENVKLFYNQTTDITVDKDNMEMLEKAAIIKEPADVTVFRGNKAVLRVTYQGRPEPIVRWLRVNRELRSDEKTEIVSENGVSYLTLDHVTYDHAGKYEVSVENSLGKDRRYFSLAVEGPPEPPADKPSAIRSADRVTIVWRSPPYDGGRTVTGYTVETRHASESTWTIIAESCHSLSYTTTETNFITSGESYRFRIRAENIHGLSEPGMESDPVRIPKQGETMLEEEKENEFEPSFEARVVEPEVGKLFDERYKVLEELGKGRYGVVKRVTELATGMSFAAKFVRTIKAKDREQVREEIRIMNILRHPKLLLLAAAYENPRETVLVTEYISGGELFERVVADDFTLTEWDSILFMRQICEGVEYMHKNKIVHLDLKPENIMCCTRTSHQIKLIDFGLAQTLKPDTPIRVLFGTPEFIPPEIINYEPIGIESDMWSVGVICYVLLTGLSPFMGDNDAETFANITRADYDLNDEAFDAISDNAKDFISNLLIKRKELRMSATQCLEHPWMAEHNATVRRVALPTEKLKKFIIRRKWQLPARVRTQGH